MYMYDLSPRMEDCITFPTVLETRVDEDLPPHPHLDQKMTVEEALEWFKMMNLPVTKGYKVFYLGPDEKLYTVYGTPGYFVDGHIHYMIGPIVEGANGYHAYPRFDPFIYPSRAVAGTHKVVLHKVWIADYRTDSVGGVNGFFLRVVTSSLVSA